VGGLGGGRMSVGLCEGSRQVASCRLETWPWCSSPENNTSKEGMASQTARLLCCHAQVTVPDTDRPSETATSVACVAYATGTALS
jgi:hypothetical protein